MTADIRLHPEPEPDCDPGDPGGDSERCVRSDPALIAEGWTRRYLADPIRAREAVELYRSLGYEVRAARLTPADLEPSCRDCAPVICRSYVLIYTRKMAGPAECPSRGTAGAVSDPLEHPEQSHGSDSLPA